MTISFPPFFIGSLLSSLFSFYVSSENQFAEFDQNITNRDASTVCYRVKVRTVLSLLAYKSPTEVGQNCIAKFTSDLPFLAIYWVELENCLQNMAHTAQRWHYLSRYTIFDARRANVLWRQIFSTYRHKLGYVFVMVGILLTDRPKIILDSSFKIWRYYEKNVFQPLGLRWFFVLQAVSLFNAMGQRRILFIENFEKKNYISK